MVNVRNFADIPKALDSAAAGTFLYKTANGVEFQTLEYSDIVGYPTTGIDSAGIISLIDASYLATRDSSSHLDATNYLDSGVSTNVIKDSADVTVKLGNYSKPISNLYLDSSSTVYIGSNHSFSLSNSYIEFNGGNSASVFATAGGGAAAIWYGDRALVGGGSYSLTDIEYFDITTTGGTADFGDLSQSALSDGDAASDGTYGLFMGGYSGSYSSQIDYVTISTLGNGADFGDITEAKYRQGALSNGTYALSFGGYPGSLSNVIDYVTIATPANAQDFGDLTQASQQGRGTADSTRGVMNLGWLTSSNYLNNIDYVTVASPSNASDFGDLTSTRRYAAAAGDGTYAIWAGGGNSVKLNSIDYIVVQTTGNATDFGDLTVARDGLGAANNDTRATFFGGFSTTTDNTIDYITMASPGNATDFGDLTTARTNLAGGTSGSPS